MCSSFDPIKGLASRLMLNVCGTSLPCNCLIYQSEREKKCREVTHFLDNDISKINAFIENTRKLNC